MKKYNITNLKTPKKTMQVLFISSGNTENGISPIVHNQGVSLMDLGHEVSFFTIKEKGIKGYLKHIFILRKFLKDKTYDIVHAHYSLSAIVASLAGVRPLVVSLMGSDVKGSPIFKYLIKTCNLLFWEKVIVKSEDMKETCGITKTEILPNGVDFKKFKPFSRQEGLKVTGWDSSKKHILFAANPNRKEKNYELAKKAFDLLGISGVELHTLTNIPNTHMPSYLNSSDVILLTSLWEGSPNVIKEAMACNCKIVSVDVGDVQKVIGKTRGCYVTNNVATEIAEKLKEALTLPDKTKGRIDIPYLEARNVAKQLTNIYRKAYND